MKGLSSGLENICFCGQKVSNTSPVKYWKSSVSWEDDRAGFMNSQFSLVNTCPIVSMLEEVMGLIILDIFCLFTGTSDTERGMTMTPLWSLGTPPFRGSSTSIGFTMTGSSKYTSISVRTTVRMLGPLVPFLTICFREGSTVFNLSMLRSFLSPEMTTPALGKVERRDCRVKVMWSMRAVFFLDFGGQ